VTLRRFAMGFLLLALAAASPVAARAEFHAAISGGAYLPSGTSSFGALESLPSASLSVRTASR
jgi:hypothetical protein